VTRIYNTTTLNNRIIRGNNNTLINRGVPVEKVAAASHTEIRPIHLRADADAPRSAQLGRDGRSLSVYRPALPTPKTAVAPRLAGEGVQRDPQFDLHSHVNRTPVTRNPVATATPERRPIIPSPTASRPTENPGRNNQFNQPNGERPGSLIMRGSDRSDRATSRDANPGQPTTPSRVFQPQTPAQPNTAGDDNRRSFNPRAQQPDRDVPQNQPNFNRPDNAQRSMDMEQQRQQRAVLQQQQREAQQQLQAQQQQERQLQQQQRGYQQQQQQQQREFQPQPNYPVQRQEAPPRNFDTPRNDFNPGNRSAPEVHSAPSQPSAPARQESGGGGGGRSGGDGGGGRGGGGGGGNNNNNNNNGGGGGGGGRGR
jgi:hypothetical protein